jgi:hypothetical protein
MVYTESDKAKIYRWRQKHPEQWNLQNKKNKKAYYERNREEIKAKALAYYYAKRAELMAHKQAKVIETLESKFTLKVHAKH